MATIRACPPGNTPLAAIMSLSLTPILVSVLLSVGTAPEVGIGGQVAHLLVPGKIPGHLAEKSFGPWALPTTDLPDRITPARIATTVGPQIGLPTSCAVPQLVVVR